MFFLKKQQPKTEGVYLACIVLQRLYVWQGKGLRLGKTVHLTILSSDLVKESVQIIISELVDTALGATLCGSWETNQEVFQ